MMYELNRLGRRSGFASKPGLTPPQYARNPSRPLCLRICPSFQAKPRFRPTCCLHNQAYDLEASLRLYPDDAIPGNDPHWSR